MDDKVVEAAREAGAVVESVVTKEYTETKGIHDALGDGKIHFHEEAVRVKFADLVGIGGFVIRELRIVEDWEGTFSSGALPLMLIEFPDGSVATTIGSGKAIIRQCRKLMARRALPVKVQVVMKPGAGGQYYEMVNPS